MPASRLSRLGNIGLAVLAVATLGAVGFAVVDGSATPEATAPPQVQEYYDNSLKTFGATPTPTATTSAGPKIPAALLAPGTKTVIFGDSWTKGTGADIAEHGYAYLTASAFGWQNTVMGEGGTGYQNAGPRSVGAFAQRIEALPVDPEAQLVVMQGSINDQSTDLNTYKENVNSTLDAAKAKFPGAQFVILGPAPSSIPPSGTLSSIDGFLADIARERGLPYVSPVAEHWINPSNYPTVIDVTQASHPSTKGHAYLADQTVKALKALAG